MFKKYAIVLFGIFLTMVAHANIATDGYLHKRISERWNITVPHDTTPDNIVSLRYLMSVIDIANEILNQKKTSDYLNDEKYARNAIASTATTDYAVENLIKRAEIEYPFSFVPSDIFGNMAAFILTATGTFYIDWGDGTKETVEWPREDDDYFVRHYYSDGLAPSAHTVKLGGRATDYRYDNITSIAFATIEDGALITSFDGCLGCVFPTLPNGKQPVFSMTFGYAPITSIPEKLFDGISGAPGPNMFAGTFIGANITSIPENLFDGLSGTPAAGMFANTFTGTSITSIPAGLFAKIQGTPAASMFASTFAYTPITSIPEKLFDGISGAPAEGMFESTFTGTSITSIPAGLFAKIQGAPAEDMFMATFRECPSLTTIGDGLFGDIHGPEANDMFEDTFLRCTSLTGPSATVGTAHNKQYLYQRWPDYSGAAAYTYDTGLDDYDCIPKHWGGSGTLPTYACEPPMPVPDVEYKFSFVPAHNEEEDIPTIMLSIAAAGTFYIDWGDGNGKIIEKQTVGLNSESTIRHVYRDGRPASEHTIRLGGRATDYITLTKDALESMEYIEDIISTIILPPSKSIDGCLGCVFPTLPNGKQPGFAASFSGAQITSIPEKLFDDISGAPSPGMFFGTFSYTALTSIPENLFSMIDASGPYADYSFLYTFYENESLTGYSPRIGGKYLYQIWPDAQTEMYTGATGLSDYDCIPTNWGGGGTMAPDACAAP